VAGILAAAITFFLTKSKERSVQLQQRKQSQIPRIILCFSDLPTTVLTLEQAREGRRGCQYYCFGRTSTGDSTPPYGLLSGTRQRTTNRQRRVELLKRLVLEVRKSLSCLSMMILTP